jgi:hypothetical protein
VYLQTLSVLFAHSRVVFVVLLIAAGLTNGLFWLPPRHDANEGVDPGVFAALAAGMLLCTWLFAFGVLLGAAVSRLDQRVDAWRLPLARFVLRRCTLISGSLLLTLALVPALARLPVNQAFWLLPCLAGACASFLLGGVALTLLETRRSVGLLGSFGFAALLMAWPRVIRDWSKALSQADSWLHVVLAASGLLLLALCAWVAWRWVRAAVPARGRTRPAVSATRGHDADVPAFSAQRARIRIWERAGTPRPGQREGLVMPTGQTLTRHDWLIAGGIALLFVAAHQLIPHGAALHVIWPAIASVGGAVHAQGSWVSPRVLLLPGGLQRQGMAVQLFGSVFRRSLPRCAAVAAPSLLAVWLVTPLTALQVTALALALPGCVVLGSAVAVDAIRRSDIWHRSGAMVAQLVPLMLCALAADVLGWVKPDAPLSEWYAWALATSAALAAAGAMWLALTARSLQRLDAGRLTPLSSPSAG